jgi:5-methylcytosine-specific restriction endonuclease McrA
MAEWDKGHWTDWDVYVKGRCRCVYCGFEGTTFEKWRNLAVDHLIPKAGGGSNDPMNKVVCCQECNRAKGPYYNPVSDTDLVQPRDHNHKNELINTTIRNCIFYERDKEHAAFVEMMEEIRKASGDE